MKVWTIQTLAAWTRFQDTGVLRADEAFIDPYFLPAYRWLADAMTTCLGPPPAGVLYPVWVWYQWENAWKRRPDLRQKGHLPHGQPGVLLECEMSAEAVLLSDFVLWHHVLNDWYVPESEADAQAFEERGSAGGAECEQRKQASWERIFDLDWVDPDKAYTAPRVEKSIQGVTWQLRADQVRAIRVFTAR